MEEPIRRREADTHGETVAGNLEAASLLRLAVGIQRSHLHSADAPFAACGKREGDGVAEVDGNALHFPNQPRGLAAVRRFVFRPQVHNFHLAACGRHEERRLKTLIVAREDHALTKRLDGVLTNEPLSGCRQHDSGKIVVAKHRGLLDRAGSQYDRLGAHLRQLLLVHERQPMVGVISRGNRRGAQLDVWLLSDHLPQIPREIRDFWLVPNFVVRCPSRVRLFLHDHHFQAVCRGRDCRGHSRHAGSDHQHVAEIVDRGKMFALPLGVHGTQPGDVPHPPLVEGEQAFGAVKRLVIKADGQKLTEPVDNLKPVARQAAESVHRSQVSTFPERSHVAADIRAAPVFHQYVHIVVPQAVDAAGPMIFEAPTEQAQAVCSQRTGNRVPREAAVLAALELELQRPTTVDPFAGLRRKSLGHEYGPLKKGSGTSRPPCKKGRRHFRLGARPLFQLVPSCFASRL